MILIKSITVQTVVTYKYQPTAVNKKTGLQNVQGYRKTLYSWSCKQSINQLSDKCIQVFYLVGEEIEIEDYSGTF